MAKRRGHGEGSIYERESDGKWVGSVNLGYVNGKRKRKVVYGETRRAVAEKLKVLLRDQQQGLPINTERQTIERFLDRWLAESVRPSVRPKTFKSYSQLVRLHLVPVLGRIRLDKLQPSDVQSFMNAKLTDGLSPRTVDYCRAVLRKALNQAFRWGLVARNVATLVDPPKRQRVVRRYLTSGEARSFLDVVAGHRLEALFTVALGLGLRQGEALGLRWQDIDLDVSTLRVTHQMQRIDGSLQLTEPKSATSQRVLALPDVATRALRDHRLRQLEERLLAGPLWEDRDLVFCTTIGRPLDARNVTRQFHRIREAAGLPWLTFHGLRHGFGSMLAAQGVHPRVAMELMGHSQISLTMQVYTHIAPELAKEAAGKIDAALRMG